MLVRAHKMLLAGTIEDDEYMQMVEPANHALFAFFEGDAAKYRAAISEAIDKAITAWFQLINAVTPADLITSPDDYISVTGEQPIIREPSLYPMVTRFLPVD